MGTRDALMVCEENSHVTGTIDYHRRYKVNFTEIGFCKTGSLFPICAKNLNQLH